MIGLTMKKCIFSFLLLSLFTQTYAASSYDMFKISIKNDSPNTCYIIKRTVSSGSISRRQLYKIASGSTTTQFELQQRHEAPATIIVTYECGEDHTITLRSSMSYCGYSRPGKVEGLVLKKTNMDAVFTVKDGAYYSNKSGYIDWIIS